MIYGHVAGLSTAISMAVLDYSLTKEDLCNRRPRAIPIPF